MKHTTTREEEMAPTQETREVEAVKADPFRESFGFGVGSVIEYRAFGGDLRTVLVDEVDFDIKNGRPGFAGDLPNDGDGAMTSVWGYCDQVVRVLA